MSDDLVFYTHPMSRGRIVRWMLEEVGATYRTEIMGYGSGMKEPAYRAINPLAKVPALVHRGVTVTGIGRYKLGRITYRAMTVGLNQSSTLGHAANAFVESCFELASAELGGIIPSNCEQVLAAQKAVGLEVPSS